MGRIFQTELLFLTNNSLDTQSGMEQLSVPQCDEDTFEFLQGFLEKDGRELFVQYADFSLHHVGKVVFDSDTSLLQIHTPTSTLFYSPEMRFWVSSPSRGKLQPINTQTLMLARYSYQQHTAFDVSPYLVTMQNPLLENPTSQSPLIGMIKSSWQEVPCKISDCVPLHYGWEDEQILTALQNTSNASQFLQRLVKDADIAKLEQYGSW